MPDLKLNVIDAEKAPWYESGLTFTCTQCGNCCTGGPGFVWISREEIVRLAAHLKLSPEQTVERYCRKIDGQFSLRERRTRGGAYDCVFLTETKVPQVAEDGQKIVLTRRGCSIYPVRPLQCRTWPFWPENLGSQKNWDASAQRCHGMNHGDRHFTRERIEQIRDAKDWPQSPPTSAGERR
jgi:Fe-S-cluster containining protein